MPQIPVILIQHPIGLSESLSLDRTKLD